MAADMHHIKQTTVTPEEILSNVSKFVRGSTHEISIPGDELARAALYLLCTLPSSRQAVLEYLCSIYDEAVNEHVLKPDFGGVDVDESHLDPIISEVQSLIVGFIRSQPDAWAPIISSWAIDLLGHISRKYADRRSMPHSSSLNELLLLWMTCGPTKSLIQISSECFTCMSGDVANKSVDALLEASVRHSPHFDWVVAHIGSCFPTTIITRVLLCGLKDYYQHMSGQTDGAHENKMSSVVGILSHMAVQHASDVRHAIGKLFQDSLEDSASEMQMSGPMYILHLSTMSSWLLQAAVDTFVDKVTADHLQRLSKQLSAKKPSCVKDFNSLMSLIIHLLMKCDYRSNRVIQLLLDYACIPPKQDLGSAQNESSVQIEIHFFCSLVMNRLIVELQRVTNARASDILPEIPLLHGLKPHVYFLSQLLATSTEPRVIWVIRLLSSLALHCGEDCAADVLSDFLTSCKENTNVSHFVQVLQDVQGKYPDIISVTIDKTLMKVTQKNDIVEPVLQNLIQLCLWEADEEQRNMGHVLICPLIKPLSDRIGLLVNYLSNPNVEISSRAMKLLTLLRIPYESGVAVLMTLCTDVVSYMFRSMFLTDVQEKLRTCESCIKYLSRLSEKTSIQSAILRCLVESTLSKEYSPLFGMDITNAGCTTEKRSKRLESKLTIENELAKGGSSSLVFHAGVIGQGLKNSAQPNSFNKADETHHRQLLLEAIWLCSCHANTLKNGCPVPVEERRLKPEAARNLALVLLEIVSPDVMYNTINWPEEEFIRSTVERDLLIRRKFNENPVLWDIMDFLCTGPGALRICSSLLRGVMATLLIQWESSREKTACSQPQQLDITQRVLELMRKGQMLPEPLCYTGDILKFLTPYEVYVLLLNIWRYMKENAVLPPSKLQTSCHPKFMDIIHSILHSHIDCLGHLYPMFFTTVQPSTS